MYTIPINQQTQLTLDTFGMERPLPTLILSGNASRLPDELQQSLPPFFDLLAQALVERPMVVINGGSNRGVIRLLGEAFARNGRRPERYIGVALHPYFERKGTEAFETQHTHLLLTPDPEWGSEVPYMGQARAVVTGQTLHSAQKKPAVLLLVDGGKVALEDMREHAQAGVPICVLLGSGILPECMAEAQSGKNEHAGYSLQPHKALLATHLVTFLHLSRPADAISHLRAILENGVPFTPQPVESRL
jgi:SLOG in TRPM, prokaryote